MKKVLITGAAGCLGQGIATAFEGKWDLRLMDVTPQKSDKHEVFTGSVADLYAVEKAMDGVDALVIAHMLSRTHNRHAYEIPTLPFDVNVKGTVNLLQQAWQQKVKKVVLISSTGVVFPYMRSRTFMTRDLEPRSEKNFYGLTKVCQEKVAEFYHLTHGMQVGVLRIGCVVTVDDETKKVHDKYGREFKYLGSALTERRDIGEVARRCLELPDLGYEIFYVMGTTIAGTEYDMEYTYKRLDWKPAFDFSWLPWDPENPWIQKKYERDLKRRKRSVNLL